MFELSSRMNSELLQSMSVSGSHQTLQVTAQGPSQPCMLHHSGGRVGVGEIWGEWRPSFAWAEHRPPMAIACNHVPSVQSHDLLAGSLHFLSPVRFPQKYQATPFYPESTSTSLWIMSN